MPAPHPLARIRKAQGHTPKSLSELSGVAWRTIEGYEQGWTVPSVHTALALAGVLKVEPLALFPPEYTPARRRALKAHQPANAD